MDRWIQVGKIIFIASDGFLFEQGRAKVGGMNNEFWKIDLSRFWR